MRRFAISIALALSNLAHAATDTVTSGTISKIFSIAAPSGAPGNADTRVYLSNVASLCPGASDPSWAYINASDPNVKSVLATAMTAFATGKQVTVDVVLTALASGYYCQISWISVTN